MRLTKKNIAEFTYHTYTIEDLHMPPPKEIIALMENWEMCKKHDLPILHANKSLEAHLEAIDYIKANKKRKPMIRDIMHLHQLIMGPFTFKLHMRTGPLMVGDRRAPDPREIRGMFLAWMDSWGKECYKSYSKKKTCMMRHCEFEYIHPFPEGNGVVGRLILLWDCLYNGTQMDIIKDRNEYFGALNEYNYELRSRIISRWS